MGRIGKLFGGALVAGGKLKSTGTIEGGDGLWYSPNTGATNESGFSALPGGYRNHLGPCNTTGDNGHWWSATEYNATTSWTRYLNCNATYVSRYSSIKGNGFSVRCVRD